MKIVCEKCGATITVCGLGRKKLNHSVINVCDSLRVCSTVKAAAELLGCSRAYIYKVGHQHGLTPKDFLSKVKVKQKRRRRQKLVWD